MKKISKDGIDLLKKLLTYDCSKRITASDALKHPWIMKEAEMVEDQEATLAALENLKNFKVD